MKKNITIKEIADMCNVSIGTVDRALNNRGRINNETKDRIIKIANDLGYTPNTYARVLASNRRYRICAMLPKKPSDFYNNIKKGMEDAAIEAKKLKCDVEFFLPEICDPNLQIDIINKLNNDRFDGLVLNPANWRLTSYIDDLVKKGVVVITFNTDLPKSKRLCFIGQNAKEAGLVCGELMGKFIRGKGNIITMKGSENIESHQTRIEGFEEILRKEYPEIKNIGSYIYHERESEAMSIIISLLKTDEEVDGIFVASSAGTVGAAMALKNLNLQIRPIIIGFDAVNYTQQALKDNRVSATICQEPYIQGYYSINFMVKRLLEDWQPDRDCYYTKIDIALKYHSSIEEITNWR